MSSCVKREMRNLELRCIEKRRVKMKKGAFYLAVFAATDFPNHLVILLITPVHGQVLVIPIFSRPMDVDVRITAKKGKKSVQIDESPRPE
jgi:hypothetical protein